MKQDMSGCIRMYQDVSRCIKMYQDISRYIRMYQNVSRCIRLVLTRTKIKVLKYPAGFPHSLMFCPILYIIYIYLCIDINMTHINTHDLPPNSPHKKPR